jgi:hypothetical protein
MLPLSQALKKATNTLKKPTARNALLRKRLQKVPESPLPSYQPRSIISA